MRRTWLLFLICLLLPATIVQLTRASVIVRVDDSAIRVQFDEQGTRVLLPIDVGPGQTLSARIKIELLNSEGTTVVVVQRDHQLSVGRNELTIPIGSWVGKPGDAEDLLWYRLRYQVTPAAASQFDKVSSVLSLSQITPDIFALNVASSQTAHEGAPYRLRVSTAHPLTKKAVAGVTIEAEMNFDGYDRPDIVLKRSAVSDVTGFATLEFQIPAAVEDTDPELKVTGRRGILNETAETEINVDRQTLIMVSTDKPLYQPGQILHTRVLMFDSSRHALANETATITVADPESSTVYREEVTSTRFGVANVDWQIPDNARLGDYRLEVKLTSEKYEDAYGAADVKISRYDLPNFAVNVKPDREFYLSGQNADVEVRADYLFGQPVKHGHVRVVRETERHWNYRDQKYETEEGDKYEGETDQDAKFVAHINLGEEHNKLKDEDYSRYKDLTYAAYFTDPTTNRTEQRRFDLRLTKDAIHVYVIGSDSRYAADFPLDFYLSTSYADGTPAACEVTISQVGNDDKPLPEVSVRTVRTNRYGLAKVSKLCLPNHGDDEAHLMFRARDDRGLTGQHAEAFDLSGWSLVRISTDKPLYRDGEPIRAEIVSNRPDSTVVLDVINENQVVQSQLVVLKEGRASVVIPFRRELSGAVTLAAYSLETTEEDNHSVSGVRTVLYPHDRDLKLNLALNQESYRPGQEASANFLTRFATGRAAESALGVVIVDKAVEERARTEREFSSAYAFSNAYRYLSNDFGNVAGLSRKDLDHIDWSKPLPAGLDLVAEVLLTNVGFEPRFFHSADYDSDAAQVFKDFIKDQIDPLKAALDVEYKENCDYPQNEDALRRFALAGGISFDSLRDPWDVPYRTAFFPQRNADVLEVNSAGPDKQFGTYDDVNVLRVERPYFRFAGEAINRATTRFHARTGGFIRDANALKSELREEGIDFDALRDPWGEPYRLDFEVNQTKFQIEVQSSGPDKQFSAKNSDDFSIWTSSIDYARDIQARIDEALVNHSQKGSAMPQNDAEFSAVLQQAGIPPEYLRDPWGRPYYTTFRQAAVYGDRVTIYSFANYGEKPKEKIETTPVTEHINYIDLRSDGADGKEGTSDDFNVATFSRLTVDQTGNENSPQSAKRGVILPGSTGAISGTVTDPNGAVIPGAKVTAKSLRTSQQYTAETEDEGTYIVKNLPAGSYEVSFDLSGFSRHVVTNVPVRSSNVTQLNVTLELGTVSEAVTVTASPALETLNASVAMSVRQVSALARLAPGAVNVVTKSGGPLSTPRLREYFPETLVWQPSLETDKQGRARLNFKLADNITTWKMLVIGSTEDGQVGVVEKEFKAFQPFFVEHDPPRVLTEGDEISLPVVVRNYLDRQQTVNLDIKPESWFTLLGPATKNVVVDAGDAARGTFDFRAIGSVKDGKQRITANGTDANDAIEKPVTVHPDGEEKSVTASDLISDQATLTFDVPTAALPNSATAELKIYPSLLAHVTESVEAIMSRPYGCGEQTISSTYPSLLWLKNYKRMGTLPGNSDLHIKAEKYLNAGYARLLNYRDESGGFTYWGRGEPDIALTAYALRFLSEASDLIAVDEDVIKQARAWLIKQQRGDGSWQAHSYYETSENQKRNAMMTAYVARVLSMTGETLKIDGTSNKPGQQPFKVASPELKRAFDYLAVRANEIDEPYLIAAYALALIEAHDFPGAAKLIAKLRTLAHEENGANYWSLETNTPFYGWGLAGRVETTALVVQALARMSESGALATASNAPDELINHGLLFLLRAKDRYGVWYSTQATINVLDTLLAFLARDVNSADNISRTAEIFVNGHVAKSVDLPGPNRLVSPITIDLSSFLQPGINRVEIKRARGSSPASAQAVATYYLPWRESIATQAANWRANGASGLRLVTKFDKTDARVSDEVNCHVEAERVGFNGYGMMLAEIGLPPGADVDRASLETAMKTSDWSINQYDVLPDRIVVYLWPRAGGTKFDFKFKPRFGLKAQTAASTVYDYYNPEARALVAPVHFIVK